MPLPFSFPTSLDYGTYHPLNKDDRDALPCLQSSAADIESLTLGCKNPRSLASFISSINSLEELNIAELSGQPDKLAKNSKILWRAIVQHKDTLKTLSIGAPPRSAWCSLQGNYVNDKGRTTYYPAKTKSKGQGALWSVEQLERVRDEFPYMEHLGVDVPVEEIDMLMRDSSSTSSDSTTILAAPILSALTYITHIPSIKISIIIPKQGNRFINDTQQIRSWDASFTPGNLDQETCGDLAKVLFSAFFKESQAAEQELKTLEVCFVTVASWDRAQNYAVKSSMFILKGKKGGARKPAVQFVDGGEWEVWEDEGMDKVN
jgi:hypothetical protein